MKGHMVTRNAAASSTARYFGRRLSARAPLFAAGVWAGGSLYQSTSFVRTAGLQTLPAASRVISAAPPAAAVPNIVLYQYQACPFCNKVRAYLDYAKLPYVIVEVEPLMKGELSWSKDYRKVPILVLDGVPVVDSGPIIDALEKRVAQTSPASSSSWPHRVGSGSVTESQWRNWVDETLVKHLTVNIYKTPTEALATFDYLTQRNFSPVLATASKYIGAAAMVMVARKRASQLGVSSGQEREQLYGVLEGWVQAVGEKPFLGGDKPDLADLAVFGALRSIESLDTMRDARAQSSIGAWYDRMEGAVGASALMHRVGEAPVPVATRA